MGGLCVPKSDEKERKKDKKKRKRKRKAPCSLGVKMISESDSQDGPSS